MGGWIKNCLNSTQRVPGGQMYNWKCQKDGISPPFYVPEMIISVVPLYGRFTSAELSLFSIFITIVDAYYYWGYLYLIIYRHPLRYHLIPRPRPHPPLHLDLKSILMCCMNYWISIYQNINFINFVVMCCLSNTRYWFPSFWPNYDLKIDIL